MVLIEREFEKVIFYDTSVGYGWVWMDKNQFVISTSLRVVFPMDRGWCMVAGGCSSLYVCSYESFFWQPSGAELALLCSLVARRK